MQLCPRLRCEALLLTNAQDAGITNPLLACPTLLHKKRAPGHVQVYHTNRSFEFPTKAEIAHGSVCCDCQLANIEEHAVYGPLTLPLTVLSLYI